jgi:small multidrug resistance pump
MKSWMFLSIAIIAEVIATSALKSSEGFTRWWPSALVVVGYCTAFFFLSLTIRHIQIGIAYAIWSGVGLALISIVGWLIFNQKLDMPAILGIFLTLAGVVVLNAYSNATQR